MRFALPLIASLLTLTLFSGAACRHDITPESQPTAVKVAQVEHASNAAGTRYSAQINPATRLERAIEVGALANTGTVAFVVADVDTVKAAFGVPDVVLPRIHLGAPLTITTEAYPGEKFEGRISLIAPSADPHSRVFEVDVTIPNT